MDKKQRLDVALLQRGLAASRERAQALILSGVVLVNGQRADKASHAVLEADDIHVKASPHPYVSRGGLKLQKAIEVFGVCADGAVAMDVGASTGGFTDVLLRAGARLVYAIDVGYGQLDWKLRNDDRVVVMERTNARHLTKDDFPQRPTLCTMDVSFISIRFLLPVIAQIIGTEGRIVTLIKPQFEAGRGRVGKKGVVRDAQTHQEVLEAVLQFIQDMHWIVRAADFSPITGPEGNIEFLFDIVSDTDLIPCIGKPDIAHIVGQAHNMLHG